MSGINTIATGMIGFTVNHSQGDTDVAYGCQKGKTIQARLEALVRLRYAVILFEETDNLREAETVLLKGVSSL